MKKICEKSSYEYMKTSQENLNKKYPKHSISPTKSKTKKSTINLANLLSKPNRSPKDKPVVKESLDFNNEIYEKDEILASKENIMSNLSVLKTQNLLQDNILLSIFNDLNSLYDKNSLCNDNLSVMAYLQSIFTFLENTSKSKYSEIGNIFGLLAIMLKEPFNRIIEQFTNLKSLYIMKFKNIKDNENLLKEKINLQSTLKENKREIENFRKLLSRKNEESQHNLPEVLLENEKLKQILKKQRRTLCEQKRKNEKIMKLLNGIRAEGINIEEIYRKTVNSNESSAILEPEVYEEIDRVGPYEENQMVFSFTQ